MAVLNIVKKVMKLKKNFILFSLSLFVVSVSFFNFSCSKKPVTNVKEINPEIEKLGYVLSSMSIRCKEAIPDGNPQEFLKDLHKVLASDSSVPGMENGKNRLLMLCDNAHPLPEDYVPSNLIPLSVNQYYNIKKEGLQLKKSAESALRRMGEAARAEGITLLVSCAYKDVESTKEENSKNCIIQHKTGCAVDFGLIDNSYSQTKTQEWLFANASTFGWSLSYPDGYEDVTECNYESLHFRYIGTEGCVFQKKWFGDVQQFMLEFINEWRKYK